jgi:hypothetical protein
VACGAATALVVPTANTDQRPARATPLAAGGTDLAAALRRAGQLLKPLGPRCRRVLALLTDARVDEFAAREAGEMAARLADEQAGVRLRAFGVGRGVAAADMLRVIGAEGAGAGGDAEGRYLALHVDEAPW